jgi:uncharacterized protein YbjT (DUF2867 family)
MFAITGITGQVGGQLAHELLRAGCKVRGVLRDAAKAPGWIERGCAIVLAAMDDAAALATAFGGAEAVFVLLPPIFDPAPGFAATRHHIAALASALASARPQRVVCLSTIGAQAEQENLLTQLQIMERVLGKLPMPVAFLRAAWFIENIAWDIEQARRTGLLASFLQPLDKPVPMVATADVARLAARLLQETWKGQRIVELEGPRRITPRDLAVALTDALDREVTAQPVPRASWEGLFQAQGMNNPVPRMRMLDGFNEGWIEFAGGAAGSRKGNTPLRDVIRGLVAGAG